MPIKYPPIAQQRGGVPLVGMVVPRNGGWSGDNQLGRQQPYGPDNRGRQTILKMDEWGPPEIWTVSLYLTQAIEDFNGFGVTAEIGFGVGGSTQVVKVDWVNGCQISLPMNAINVMAIFEDVDITTEGQGLQLGVQLCRGARGGQDLPRLTMAEFVEATSVNVQYRIPNFAKNIVIVPDEAVGFASFYSADLRVQLFSGNNAGGLHTTAAADGTRTVAGQIRLPVTGQARFVDIEYVGVGALPRYTMYAEIDG